MERVYVGTDSRDIFTRYRTTPRYLSEPRPGEILSQSRDYQVDAAGRRHPLQDYCLATFWVRP